MVVEERMEMQLRKHLFRTTSVVIVLAALACVVYSLSLPMGSLASPGAGMWPFLVSCGMGIAALVTLVTEKDASAYEPLSKRTWIIVAGFGLMIAFIFAFSAVGLTLSCLALTIVWLRWMAHESWAVTLILGVGLTALFVVGFDILLGVPMPNDILLNIITGRGF